MAGANSNIQLAGLDFNDIKTNLKTFLQSQDTFKDYNFEGAGLSVLLDILAYNTQYNAFYLNMIGNEMFLDTALQRSSAISHAKLLNYTPRSMRSPEATVNIIVSGVVANSLTLYAGTNFLSESVDSVNYNFVTTDTTTATANALTGIVSFNDVTLKQGISTTYSYTVNSTTNPTFTFELPDSNIDTNTLRITVQQSSSNSFYDIYTLATSYSDLTSESLVYFLQESMSGTYEVIFGDGILGKKLNDGNIINASYLITQGTLSEGANNFVLADYLTGFTNTTVYGITPSARGQERETLDSIKFQAPKSYAAQGRAVTKEDYITLINQNNLGITFDAVNVWGGENNNPPVYGKTFICLKPSGALTLSDTQKKELVNKVIKPISVVTVTPQIVDPDYTYIQINADVMYDSKKTNLTSSQIQQLVKSVINTYCNSVLNTFNSTLSVTDIAIAIKNSSNAIITSDINIKLQKKLFPNLSSPNTYKLYYNTTLQKGSFLSGVGSLPPMSFFDTLNNKTVDNVYLEEIASNTYGVDTISVINPGFAYQVAPTITILGDGTGATAEAVIINGQITKINVLTSGENYSSAVVQITPNQYDTTGQGAAAVVNFQGKNGTLRTYYFNNNKVKTVLDSSAGTIDYDNGIITLTDFAPTAISDPLGQLTVYATPYSQILSSTFNTIITVDQYDPNSIVVNMSSK